MLAALAAASCGSPPAPGAPDGELDCPPDGDVVQIVQIALDPEAEGARTPYDAMLETAGFLASGYGPADYWVYVVDARTGTVVADGAEVARLKVAETPSETFGVEMVERCPYFQIRG